MSGPNLDDGESSVLYLLLMKKGHIKAMITAAIRIRQPPTLTVTPTMSFHRSLWLSMLVDEEGGGVSCEGPGGGFVPVAVPPGNDGEGKKPVVG